MTFFNLKTFKVMKKTKLPGSGLSDPLKKILLTMRIVFALLVLGILQANATDAYAQMTRLSLNVTDAQLVTVLDKIEDETEFFFLYNEKLLDTERKVSIKAEDQLIDVVLDKLFAGTDITHTIIDRKIILIPEYLVKEYDQTQQKVTGRVTAATGEPLPGVTVVVRGKLSGTATDMNGSYSIDNVQPSDVLVFSFIGMKEQEVTVENQTTINVVMSEELISMDAVVVTALGIKREQRALGYSVQELDGASLQQVSGVDVGTSLTGKVAGILVQNSTDFNVEPRILLRGSDPIIVIDGVPYTNKRLNDIPAEDIESMSVLKGATASALYGFRGRDGAIMITTKNGSTNKAGVTVDVNTHTMFSAGYLAIPEKQSVYGRGTSYIYDINSDNSWGTFMDGSIQRQWDPIAKEFRDYEYLPIGKDNFKNFLEQGYITNNNVSVGINREKTSFRSSFNWTENKGRYPNSMLDKYSYSIGGEINLDRFRLTSNMAYTKRTSPNLGSNGYTSYDPMYTLLIWSSADFDIRDYKDNYWLKPLEVQNNHFGYNLETGQYSGKLQNNPYFDRWERTNEVSRDIFNADLTAGYDITKWLTFTARTGIDFFVEGGKLRISKGSYTSAGNTGGIPGIPYPWGESQKGSYMTGQSKGFSINSDFLLGGSKSFFDKLDIEYMAGGTIFFERNDNLSAKTMGGISIPGYFSLNASVNPAAVAESTYGRQVNSLYGRFALSWNRLVYLDFTGRNDWVSMMANAEVPTSDRSYFYPSASGSLVVSELLPESTRNWLDLLKLRTSYTLAKTAPAPYTINSVFSVTPSTWNDLTGASAPRTIYLNSYSPNSYTTTELGIQSILFRNRISADVTYYSKRIFDELKSGPLSSATGYTGIMVNTDEVKATRGWEVSVGATPVKTKDIEWTLNANWTTYKQIYLELDSVYSTKQPWIKPGSRTDAFALRDYLYVPSGEYAGQLIWNNGRVVKSSYNTLYGYSNPDWVWGLNSSLRYRNFVLYLSFDGVVGGLMSTRTESYMWQSGVHPNSLTPERELDALTPGSKNYLGEGVKVVGGTVTYDTYGNITSDTREYAPNDVYSTYKQAVADFHNTSAWGGSANPNDVYERTFMKLRELSLTYQLPSKVLGKLVFIKGASVSFIGQNVLFWAKDFKYSDPDGGSEDFADPSVRYLGGNIKLSF